MHIYEPVLAIVNMHELVFRLYKSLGEYDVVNAILSTHVTTHPVTLQAIDAEVRGDYALAAKLYNQVSSAMLDVISLFVSGCRWTRELFSRKPGNLDK